MAVLHGRKEEILNTTNEPILSIRGDGLGTASGTKREGTELGESRKHC